MGIETITSRSNPLMSHIRKLTSSGAYRRKTGAFVCDGRKLLSEAQQWHIPMSAVVFCDGETPPEAPGARLVQVSRELMAYIAPSDTPQGVLAVCTMAEMPLPEALMGRRYLLLDGVQDPGNVGTILRTADAFDCDGMFLVGACADLYNPKTVRATMGALFRLPVWRCAPAQAKGLLSTAGIPLLGAALRSDTRDVRQVDYTRAAVAIGSEGRGLSEEVLALCDQTVRIPMSERCESLNAAVAASVLLWEMYR